MTTTGDTTQSEMTTLENVVCRIIRNIDRKSYTRCMTEEEQQELSNLKDDIGHYYNELRMTVISIEKLIKNAEYT